MSVNRPKPEPVIALHRRNGPADRLFTLLQRAFDVNQVSLDLSSIDANDLDDQRMIAALTMRKLQALFYASKPVASGGPSVTSNLLLTYLDEVVRSLEQLGLPGGRLAPSDVDGFTECVAAMRAAARSVVDAIDGNGMDITDLE